MILLDTHIWVWLADQIIVATARVYGLDLLTVDDRMLKYEHVRTC